MSEKRLVVEMNAIKSCVWFSKVVVNEVEIISCSHIFSSTMLNLQVLHSKPKSCDTRSLTLLGLDDALFFAIFPYHSIHADN